MLNTSDTRKEFAGLEMARFLCALAVMIYHYQFFSIIAIPTNHGWAGYNWAADNVDKLPLYWLLWWFYHNGFFAVQIFWMISGFIFFWKYSDQINQGTVSAYRFFVLRFSRLYPLQFATLIAVALLQLIYINTYGISFVYYDNDISHFVLHLVFASNWVSALQTFNGPVWSVSIEVLVYGFFLAVVSCIRPSLRLCIVVAIAMKLGGRLFRQMFFGCAEYFFIGGVLQQLEMVLPTRYKLIALTICVLGLCVSVGSHFKFGSITGLSVFVVATFVLLGEVISLHRIQVTKVGDLTYASYLLHFPIQLAMVLLLDASGFSRAIFLAPFAFVLFFASTFGLAWIVFRVFEMPAQDALRAAWLCVALNAFRRFSSRCVRGSPLTA